MAKKKKKKEAITIFDFLNAITYSKENLTIHPEFERLYNPFMINRWLSMEKNLVLAALYGDKILNVSKKLHFKFLQNFIVKGKYFITYKKAPKEKNDKYIEIISKYFDVNERQAKEIVYILTDEQINIIEKSFGGKK